MGNQPGVETFATKDQISRFKADFNTLYTKSVDERAFYALLGDSLPAYVGRQIQLVEKFNSKALEDLGACTDENQTQWKAFIRQGIPDM